MKQYAYRPYYRRNLPHIQPAGACLFVTCRLAGSLPRELIFRLTAEAEARARQIQQTASQAEVDLLMYEEQKRYFSRVDRYLDKGIFGPTWLQEPEIAQIAMDSFHFLNGRMFDLDAFCVMHNHVHAVFAPLENQDGGYIGLPKIMHAFKRHTAFESNQILGRSGPFWQHESYDHVVRGPDEWERILGYVLHNPVKAGLVENWQDWPFSWQR